jgi:Dihaem cytochrome c
MNASCGSPLFRFSKSVLIVAVAAPLVAAGALPLLADAKIYPPIADPIVAKECGACHMKFPAGLMPVASWARIVAGLNDHFGENAGVDAETALHMVTYLTANAGVEVAPKPPRGAKGAAKAPAVVPAAVVEAPLRITELTWFQKKHGPRRISPASLTRKNARSAGDCIACHRDAEKGDFDE